MEPKEFEAKYPKHEWGNCPKCDWFYKKKVLDFCPMCRHPWRNPIPFEQPPYESPSFDS